MINYNNLADSVSGKIDGVVAPVRGLNTQAPLAGLSPNYAIQLDNWVCQPDALVTRTGCVSHATGFVGFPKTLMVYSNATVSQLFAADNTGIYNVGTPGAIGAAVTSLSKGTGASVNFATSAGQFLVFCNGLDNTKVYNGTTWTDSTVTGPATSSFKSPEAYRQRLFFLQNNFLGFYYLGADAIGGAATAFRIGSLTRKGGSVVAHGTWSIDGGSGPDDHYVLVTSEGEVVIFRGSDPAVVANWSFVGCYYVSKPVGANCLVKYGGDLLFLCESGILPVSSLNLSSTRDYGATLSVAIQPTISNSAVLYGGVSGWKIHVIPKRNLILVNAPLNEALSIQYVLNTFSKGWSTFSGWNATDFIEYDGETYFTTGNQVARAFTGYSDFGASISAVCDTSYNRFGTRTQLQPNLVRAVFASTNLVNYTIGLAQDFSGNYYENFYSGNNTDAGLWDSGLWDTALWGGAFNLRREWVTIAAKGGIALSTRFKIESNQGGAVLLAFDYKFAEQGLVF